MEGRPKACLISDGSASLLSLWSSGESVRILPLHQRAPTSNPAFLFGEWGTFLPEPGFCWFLFFSFCHWILDSGSIFPVFLSPVIMCKPAQQHQHPLMAFSTDWLEQRLMGTSPAGQTSPAHFSWPLT